MSLAFFSAAAAAMLLSCTTQADRPPAPDDLVDLFVRAAAYRASGESRLCADPALRPRYEAAAARFQRASRELLARYSDPRLNRSQPPPFADRSTLCTNATAAATAVSGFEAAVAGLEARVN
jgi:hypothetical protein